MASQVRIRITLLPFITLSNSHKYANIYTKTFYVISSALADPFSNRCFFHVAFRVAIAEAHRCAVEKPLSGRLLTEVIFPFE